MKARVFMSRELPTGSPDAQSVVKKLQKEYEVEIWQGKGPPSPKDLREALVGCDGFLCLLTDIVDRALLESCPQLRVVSSCSVGVDHVDVAAATELGVAVGHTPGVLTETTADFTFALLLAAARRVCEADRFVRTRQWTPDRRWEPDMLLGMDLHEATIGVIGLGPIGVAVARRAQGFGMRVLGWSRSERDVPGVERVALDTLLAQSDFVTVHVALCDETRNLIDASALSRMKAGAVLVNTARGGIVAESALISALQSGAIAAAGLDVFEQEPMAPDDPLLKLENVVLAPHIGSASHATRSRMVALAMKNLVAGLEGRQLPHSVNPQRIPRLLL